MFDADSFYAPVLEATPNFSVSVTGISLPQKSHYILALIG
jgi:hypothetical protein